MQHLCPDTDKQRLFAHDELSSRKFKEDQESIDKLWWDIEKLLERASFDLPDVVKKLNYVLPNKALPESVSFQLKLLPRIATVNKSSLCCSGQVVNICHIRMWFSKKVYVFIDFGDSSFASRKFPDLKGQLLLRQVHFGNLVLDNEYPHAMPHRTETSESELDMPTY